MGRISHALSVIGGAVVLICALLVVIDVILRQVFNNSGIHSFELTEFATAFVVSLAFADTLYSRHNIRIDVLYSKLPTDLKGFLDILTMAGVATMASLLAYYGFIVAQDSFLFGSTSKSTLQAPLFVPQGLWAIGLVWFAIMSIYLLVRSIFFALQGRLSLVHMEIGANDAVEEELETALAVAEENAQSDVAEGVEEKAK